VAAGSASGTVKFYLDPSSAVVDAPSIGDRMASRLNQFGIHTVEHLLNADAETLASNLAHRRVTSDVVRSWQNQARLVCRIPFLRGHDAQLLVACQINSPEAMSGIPADTILSKVLAYARSSEGQRMLRGSKVPDLAEVNDWLNWAAQSRTLHAA
jgi:hypothetical protein